MKRVVLTLFILVGSASCVWADDSAMAATTSDIEHTILGGVVKSVSWADPVKGTKSEITVKNTAGKMINIYVMPTTTLWDADVKAIMPDRITARSHVNVIYFTTPEGINVGKSIKILK
jgi:hypothetical protein